MILAYSETYCVISDMLDCLKENTSWLFIKKIVITVCNWLSLQDNRLIQWSNQLDYLFNWLKFSSKHLKTTQEQCNRLDTQSNQLKCSCSLPRHL